MRFLIAALIIAIALGGVITVFYQPNMSVWLDAVELPSEQSPLRVKGVWFAFSIGVFLLISMGLAARIGETAKVEVRCPYCGAEMHINPKDRTIACQRCNRVFEYKDGEARPIIKDLV
jgi:hypothetical protein